MLKYLTKQQQKNLPIVLPRLCSLGHSLHTSLTAMGRIALGLMEESSQPNHRGYVPAY